MSPISIVSRVTRVATVTSHHSSLVVDSSQTPETALLFVSSEVLDIMATLSNLAVRSTSFANLNAECLHWKYRRAHDVLRVPARGAFGLL